jgi:hypothetical protein
MFGGGTRDARRTERYLDGLAAADERRAVAAPADADLDPAVRFAASELRAGLTRVHPSFRFEDSLAARLASAALRLKAGLPVEDLAPADGPATMARFPGKSAGATSHDASEAARRSAHAASEAATPDRAIRQPVSLRRLPEIASRPSRPLIVGGVGVGVASAALSLGAVYVAWRHSHPASGRMGRAVKAAHGRGASSAHNRRTGVINGILGVVSNAG